MCREIVFEVFTTLRGSSAVPGAGTSGPGTDQRDPGAALQGWVAEDASEQPERR